MKQTFFLIVLLAVLILGFGSIYIINEAEQAVVTQFGKPVGGAVTDAGIHFKTPIIQTVIKFDKRILEWDGSANEIPTLDNKYVFIDAFARWRISDALQFYKAAKNEMLAQSILDDILDGAVRDEIANRTMVEIVRSSNRVMAIKDVESSSVNINNEIVYSKLMDMSDIYNYSLKDNFVITTGNAGNIIVSVGGQIVGKLGKKGEVLDSINISSEYFSN